MTYKADARVPMLPDDGMSMERLVWTMGEFEKKWGLRPDRVEMTQATFDDIVGRCFVDQTDDEVTEAGLMGMRVIIAKETTVPGEIRVWNEWRLDPVHGMVSV